MLEGVSAPECKPGKCCSENFYCVKPGNARSITSWKQIFAFYRKCERHPWKKRWVFRGHKDSSWCLETSLERAIRRHAASSLEREAPLWEHRLLRHFKRVAPLYLPQAPDDNNWMEWLALLRHYGGPARLLDWTYSFFVAALQALQDAEDGKECSIWALDLDWWKEQVMVRIPILALIREDEDPHSKAEFKVIRRLKGKKGVWPVNAFRLNERLHAQQGVFLLPLDSSHSFMDNLKELATAEDARDHLWKITISCSRALRKESLTELRRMNIQNQTLFHGLDGLAKDLENYILMPEFFVGVQPKP